MACGYGEIIVITVRSLYCGLWSREDHCDHYEVIVLWPVVTEDHCDHDEVIVL